MVKSSGSRAIDFTQGRAGNDDATNDGERQRMNSWLVLVMLLISVTMLFVAFTSAYVARQQQPGWFTSPLPTALWFSTLTIVLCSVAIEISRRAARSGDWIKSRSWLSLTAVFGTLFVVSQWIAWQQLVSLGFYVEGNPHGSFFYLLTAVHVLHLVGGLIALGYTQIKVNPLRPRLELAGKANYRPKPSKTIASGGRFDDSSAVNSVATTAVYWHFLGALWVYIFALLFVF